ncbi:MAG: hypothetical protein JJU27_03265 [Gammaproteobacteria bacterium]|nr:hypothetical protein [Gammaproteobacteria bacterium]
MAIRRDDRLQERRSEYDVTNCVRVSSVADVRTAVLEIYHDTWPSASTDTLWLAFHDFDRLFSGLTPGYVGCDTSYHDMQHTLDMVLATARLMRGYELACDNGDRLGAERAAMGLVTALFHDAGYIRHLIRDAGSQSGAEFTVNHVTRSGRFLADYLPGIGLGEWAALAPQIVHYTGYEVNLDHIELDDPRDCIVGHLMGTGDLLAQMADRCYLEKCRDRLFPEFVLGGVAVSQSEKGEIRVVYGSGRDLLRQTFSFYEESAKRRLVVTFNRAYRYLEVMFDGRNPYMECIHHNLEHLGRLLRSNDWSVLRRHPPCFTAFDDAEGMLKRLALQRLRELERHQLIRLRRPAPAARRATANAALSVADA